MVKNPPFAMGGFFQVYELLFFLALPHGWYVEVLQVDRVRDVKITH
jgi:hypothetical protein